MLTATVIGHLLLPPKHTNGIDSQTGNIFTHVTFPFQVATYNPATANWTELVVHLHLYGETANQGFANLKIGTRIAARISHLWPSYEDHGDTIAQYINLDVSAIELLDSEPAHLHQPQRSAARV